MTWLATASLACLRERANILAKIRSFFDGRGYLAVETPYLSRCGVTDVHLKNIAAQFAGKNYYLQTSPEYHMKRLLAGGSGPIYQLARVFRDDEFGRWHNPEFSLLEWYQVHVDHYDLMDELEALFQELLPLSPPFVRLTYQQAFEQACQLDPLEATVAELIQVCHAFNLAGVLDHDESVDQYLYLLMAMVVEPYLAKTYAEPVIVDAFPASQAALAQISGKIAHRFELYWQGVELANGFHELLDAQAQRQRFEHDLLLRASMGVEKMCIDEQLLQAMEHGLPPCAGVAVGIDRLLALLLKQDSLSAVMAFPFPDL